ncbi:APOBEC1 complementation factor-like [Thrips palmi]|uniref:APOBEC1 complementation factor-like n=1 Tax=Thrips palmi TaxID=161013 RepID=A0A6P8ZDF0_THRPL|nr:APOBEC1 complementation factor-like [Thrips palmi]
MMSSMSVRPPSTEEVRAALEKRIGPNTGYVLSQVHGQRKLFNPLWKEEFQPREGSEVFVGRLPRDLYEDELAPPFLEVGPIYEIRLMMNFSGTNRGFAFVSYFNPETAQRAVERLNNFQIRKGQLIGVLPSVNNRRLFIGGLMASAGLENFLRSWLHQVTEGVQTIKVFPPGRRTHLEEAYVPYRYAVVTYTSHRQAAMARRSLIPIKNEVFGPQVVIDWADPNRMEASRGHQNA